MDKMKKVTLMLITMSAATQVMAGISDGSKARQNFLNSASDQTPYQKLETLYNRATPMRLDQFLLPTDPEVKSWYCFEADKVSSGPVAQEVPMRLQAKIVLTPAVPGAGPLFPGSPEQDKIIDVVEFFPTNLASYTYDEFDLGQKMTSQKFQMNTSPGVSTTFLSNPNDPNSTVTITFRITDGLVVGQQTDASASEYFYCYKE
jgi:hypothetical protein